MADTRERRLTEAFVRLADTLVDDYDVVDLLQTLVDTASDVLDGVAAGLVLAGREGELAVVASTSEDDRMVDLMQPESGDGPAAESFLTGEPFSLADIEHVTDATFARNAAALGFRSLHSVPMRLRGEVIGALTLFRDVSGVLHEEDAAVMRGLADIATIGILHERALRDTDLAQKQLQHALNSRVVIEQAKGVIAHTRAVNMDAAFALLRSYARNNQLNLREVAEQVIARSISI